MWISLSEVVEGVKIGTSTMRTNKLRTILTTLGIFIGVLVVTVVISVIQGLNTYVGNEISSLGADTIYISRFPWMINSYEEYLRLSKRKRISKEDFEFVQKHATLAKVVVPNVSTQKRVKYRNESLDGTQITGSSPGYMITSDATPEFGRFFTDLEYSNRRSVCVIGSGVAESCFKRIDPLGKRLKISGHDFLVVGILEKQGETFGQSMDNNVVIPFTTFQKIFGSRRSLNILVKPLTPELLENMTDELYGLMRRSRGLQISQEDDFSLNLQSQLMDTYNSLTRVLWIVLIGIGSISLLVGGIGIMNIMLVSVTERTREIGIRKALGAKKRIVMLQFLVESMFISAIGVILGIIASIGIAQLAGHAAHLPVNISGWVISLGVGFTLCIGIFFGLYPASKAARLDPIVALRHE